MSDELNDFIQKGLSVQEAIDALLTTVYEPITCPCCGLSMQATLRDNEIGLIMSPHDRENTGQLLDGKADHFSAKLMQLIAKYDSPLDPGIRRYVEVLNESGVETFESCQGGNGHAYLEPTIRFYGDRAEGFKAFAVAKQHDFPVASLRRIWPIVDDEPTGPWWEMTFSHTSLD